MKTFISLFFLCCNILVVFGQNITISDDIAIRNDNGYQILGRYRSQVLLFRDKNSDYEVVAFNEQMRIAWQKKISLPEKRIEILDAIGGNDFFAVIYSCREKNEVKIKIHRFDSNAKFIDSTTIGSVGNRFNTPALKNIFSENNKKLLLYTPTTDNQVELWAFDIDNMKLLWQQKYVFDESININEHFSQAIITNDGTAFFIFEKDETASIFGNNRHDLDVFTLTAAGTALNKISIKEIATYGISFVYDNQQQRLCVAGLFSEKSKTRPTGIFWATVSNNQTSELMMESFGDEVVSAVAGKTVTNNKGLSDLRLRDILLRKDGGLVVAVEEYRQVAHMSNLTNRGMNMGDVSGRFVTDYYCDNIILTSFNPDGSVHWKKVLAKKQFSQGDQGLFSSFGVMKTPKEIRFLFNDDARLDTTTSEYVLKGDGSVDRHSMFNTTDQEILLRFRDGLQVASDEFLVPSEMRGRLRVVRLKY
jgi:hypothetical protein